MSFSSSNHNSIEYRCACILANMCQISLGQISGVKMQNHMVCRYSNFIKYCHITFLSYCINLYLKSFCFSISLTILGVIKYLTVSHSDEHYLVSYCVLICIFDVRKMRIFSYVYWLCVSSGNCLFIYFPVFFLMCCFVIFF